MRIVSRGRWSVVSITRLAFACLLLAGFCFQGCSVPNLEEADCIAPRDVVREFYSFHFGHDMRPTEENLRSRTKFLTGDLGGRLVAAAVGAPASGKDYFTNAEDLPKAFRVADCKVVEPGKRVEFKVILFWRDDATTEQKHVFATVKKGDVGWLIDSVSTQENK